MVVMLVKHNAIALCDRYTAARIDIWGKPYLDSSDISNVNVRDLPRFTSKQVDSAPASTEG